MKKHIRPPPWKPYIEAGKGFEIERYTDRPAGLPLSLVLYRTIQHDSNFRQLQGVWFFCVDWFDVFCVIVVL